MKCIVIETSPERTNAKPVTNEDGTPHVYATMAEARAELKANGYSYNRENQRYYINGTEYRAYILRADSEEYAKIVEQAEQQAAPEYTEPEHIQTVSGNKIYRSIDPVTGWNVFTVAGRDFWELAEARYFAQCNPTDDAQRATDAETAAARAAFEASRPTAEDIRAKYDNPYLIWEDDPATETPENYAAEDAAYSLINAYADAISERPAETDPEYMAAFAVAGEEIAGWHGVADIHDRATVAQMVEAIADRARTTAADDAAADPEDLEESAPIYQRYELLAYLGEPDDYDVDAIEAEATTYTADGARVWSAFGEDLAAIAERHELFAYYAI